MHADPRLLHHADNRADIYRQQPPLWHEDTLDAWCCASPELIRALLRHPDVDVIDFRGVVASLSARFGQDFSHSAAVLDHVTLGLSGPEHLAARRAQTLFLKARAEPALDAFRSTLGPDLAVAAARRDEAFDFAFDVLAPALGALFVTLTGVAGDAPGATPSLSQLFDRYLGVNRRLQIEKRLGARLVELAAAKVAPEEALMRVALTVVGADSLFAALCESLRAVLAEAPDMRLCDIDWPAAMPRTGVPYVDRFARKAIEIDGQTIAAGARLRLYVEAIAFAEPERATDLFGVGAHLCLGKAISQQVWLDLTAALAALPVRLSLIEHAWRRSDFLFNAPSQMRMVFHD